MFARDGISHGGFAMRLVRPALAFAMLLAIQSSSFAQAISSSEIERGLKPFPYPAYDGMNMQQRYNYGATGILYFNGDPNRMWSLYHYDKLARSLSFGYQVPLDTAISTGHPITVQTPDGTLVEAPADQVFPAQPIVRRSNVRVGFGLGFYRWR